MYCVYVFPTTININLPATSSIRILEVGLLKLRNKFLLKLMNE